MFLTPFAALPIQVRQVLGLPRATARKLAAELAALQCDFSFAQLEETAIPSYTHRLAPIRYLFLRRVRVALDLTRKNLPTRSEILDFGCGAGLMTIALKQHGFKPVRCDIRPQFCAPSAQAMPGAQIENFAELKRFRGCVALDVLEHLSENELRDFAAGFAPDAVLIVSGPTENFLYQIGRRVAGFKGGYHQRDVFQILQFLQSVGWNLESPPRYIFSRWFCPAFVVVALHKGAL